MESISRHRAVAALLGCLVVWLSSVAEPFAAAAGLPPVITSQPQPQTTFPGANINLRVSVVSLASPRYVWRWNGLDLPADFPGQSTPLLALREVTIGMSGGYSVVVSNNFGAVTSETAVVTVNPVYYHAVGYVNLTAKPGLSFFCTALGGDGTNQTVLNRIPSAPDGVSLFKIDGNGFAANNYLDGWSDPEMNTTVGEGWFLRNPYTNDFTHTQVGFVPEGRLINRLPAGYSICANIVPQAGLVSSTLSFPNISGSRLFFFDTASQGYQTYEANDFSWFPVEPRVGVGQAFWAHELAAVDWIRDFSVNPRGISPLTYLIVQPLLDSETGEINFFTYNPDPAFGRVLDLDGVTPLDSNFAAQLYAGLGNAEETLVPIGRPQTFLNGAGAGYIRGANLKLPGVPGGTTVHLQLRVWETCAGRTYEQAVYNGSAHGRSAVVNTVARAVIENGEPGLPPNNVNSFASFAINLGQDVPLRLGRVHDTGTNTVEICFATQPDRSYCLQRASTSDEPAQWHDVPGAQAILGTGHVVTFIDTAEEQCYYRLCPGQ